MHLLIISILPAAILMVVIYKCDRVEKEPVGLVLAVMVLGMLTAIPSTLCELIGDFVLDIFWKEGTMPVLLIENFIVIGLAEEFWKLFVVKLLIWKHKEFNYRFDAIVYCVASSLGFALLENVFYVFQFGFRTGISRALLSVPGHCTFAVFMGFFLGDAKLYEVRGNKRKARMYRILSLAAPVLQHGFYDFCLSVESGILSIIFLLFVVVCDVIAIIRVIRSEKQDVPFYVLKEGDRWIQNPVWMQMAAASMDTQMPHIQFDSEQIQK